MRMLRKKQKGGNLRSSEQLNLKKERKDLVRKGKIRQQLICDRDAVTALP